MSATLTGLELPPSITVGETTYRTELLLDADSIQSRVSDMGGGLAERYAERGEVHVLTVMNGALHFASDLRRAMQTAEPGLKITSDQVKVVSYAGTRSSGVLRFDRPPSIEIKDKHVLVAEDIYDSGLTLAWLTNYLRGQKPASLEIAVAVSKNNPHRTSNLLGSTVMHAGFEIPNKFVIGYGLDIEQRYRDLSGIYTLSEVTPNA